MDATDSRQLAAIVYEELRRVAHNRLRATQRYSRLQTTELVHETYLRMQARNQLVGTRAEFFRAAAGAMRDIVVNHARRRGVEERAQRYGPQSATLWPEVDLGDFALRDDQLLAVDEALLELGESNSRLAEVVVLRFFGGLTMDQAGDVLGLCRRTIERDWRYARAWLHERLEHVHEPN